MSQQEEELALVVPVEVVGAQLPLPTASEFDAQVAGHQSFADALSAQNLRGFYQQGVAQAQATRKPQNNLFGRQERSSISNAFSNYADFSIPKNSRNKREKTIAQKSSITSGLESIGRAVENSILRNQVTIVRSAASFFLVLGLGSLAVASQSDELSGIRATALNTAAGAVTGEAATVAVWVLLRKKGEENA